MNAVVIIPVFEPEGCLPDLVESLWGQDNRVIIVDDGSSEETQHIFWELGEKAVVLHHAVNMGKGAAIKTALSYIRDNMYNCDIVGIMDGDGQHAVKDMERIIYRARSNTESLILGVRQVGRKMPLRSRFGNMLTQKVFQMYTKINVSDTQSGLRAFHRKLMDSFTGIEGVRYEYEMNILLFCAKQGIEIVEVPIETIYHDKGNSCSHFHVLSDSVRIYKQFFKFLMSSFSSFLLDYALFGVGIFILGKAAGAVLAANVLARCISAVYNYYINTKIVFGVGKKWSTAVEYLILAVGILCLNNVFLQMAVHVMHNPYTAKMLTEALLFSVSFLVQKFLMFPGKKRVSP